MKDQAMTPAAWTATLLLGACVFASAALRLIEWANHQMKHSRDVWK